MRQLATSVVVLLATVSDTVAAAPVPAGGTFQINIHTLNFQSYPSVAADAAGNFVVVWVSSYQDGSASGVFGQRFAASGVPSGTEFQVNSVTSGVQGGTYGTIEVASGSDGEFVVVFSSLPLPGPSHTDVHARRYDNTGTPIGAEFRVNDYTIGGQVWNGVATAPNGDFAIAWVDIGRDGSGRGVFARRFDSSGTALGDEFQVTTYTINSQGEYGPRLVWDVDGTLTAVWESSGQDGSDTGVFGRRFDSSGAPIGVEFQINVYTPGHQRLPSIAADADGNVIVVWQSEQDGSLTGVLARRYDGAGAELGTEFLVNTHTGGLQAPEREAVFADANGRFTIVWAGQFNLLSATDGFRRHYDSDGSPISGELQIDGTLIENQPHVDGGPAGNFVVVWETGKDIFGRRFAEPTATPTVTPTVTATATPVGACPPSIDGGCATGFEKGALLVKEGSAGKEKLIAKMVKGPALTQTALGDPLSPGGTVYSLCVYDDAGNLSGGADGSIVIDRAGDDCGGSACWGSVGGDPPNGKGYKYYDATLAADGVLKLLYKGGDAGKSKLIVKGKGPNLPDGISAALQSTTFATMQLRSSDGTCLSVTLDDVTKQEPGFFKAKFSAP